MKPEIKLNKAAEIAISRLEAAGYSAYIVGGYVRDSILGLPPGDCDIATSAHPEEALEVFEGYASFTAGIKHGTVTVMIENEPIEITTFRTDSTYSDGRHPDSVNYTSSICSDLARRDFTVNALAFNPKSGIVDIAGGVSDLQSGIIRAVGKPELRFSEDGLRILRALRFASVYGFNIEYETASAALKCAGMLDALSAERIYSEIKKLLCGRNAEKVLLEHSGVICRVIPELTPCIGFHQHNPHHIYDVYTHTVKTVSGVPGEPALRLAALFHDIGKPNTFSIKDGIGHFYGHCAEGVRIAETIFDRLKSDKRTKNEALILIKYHDTQIPADEKYVRRYLNRLGNDTLKKLIALQRADNHAQAPEHASRIAVYDEILEIIKKIETASDCFTLKQLKINGDTLISLGIPKGKEIGIILNSLLDKVISGEIENDPEKLKTEALHLRNIQGTF